jgi:hypothetical protein
MRSGNGKPQDGGQIPAAGRTDSAAELRLKLPTAPLSYLEGALKNPQLGTVEVVELLRNRAATSALLVRIGGARAWTRSYDVKKGLVRHLRTPATLARTFLPHLYWKDLADIAEDPKSPALLRHRAEEVLARRIEEMSLGEKVALARRARRGVIEALRTSKEPSVLKALLSNPRLVERDAVTLASDDHSPREVLSHLAAHPAWGGRYQVRISLVGNPGTPIPSALKLLEALPARDLERIAQDEAVPKIVRVRAERRLHGVRGG